VSAAQVAHVNAHATSTPEGDLPESRAIADALGSAASGGPVVSATKSMTGHLLGGGRRGSRRWAAILALRDRMAPPTVNLEDLDDEVAVDGRHPRPARLSPATAGEPMAALANAFGFGGHKRDAPRSPSTSPPRLSAPRRARETPGRLGLPGVSLGAKGGFTSGCRRRPTRGGPVGGSSEDGSSVGRRLGALRGPRGTGLGDELLKRRGAGQAAEGCGARGARSRIATLEVGRGQLGLGPVRRRR